MKNLVVLFSGELSSHALEPFMGADCAFSRVLSASSRLPGVVKTIVFSSDTRINGYPVPSLEAFKFANQPCEIAFLHRPSWTVSLFLSELAASSAGFDHVYVLFADTPFLDIEFASHLMDKHTRYCAEYTFSDGYPLGLAPEILSAGITPMLARLAVDDQGVVGRSVIFDVLKKDINSFDIETEIAPTDVRQLRVTLACDTLRNTVQCAALSGITAENYPTLLEQRRSSLCSLPAYYALQVSGRCPFECPYCPYPAYCKSGSSTIGAVSVLTRTDFMPPSDFALLLDKIARYSEDAVVSLSLQGESSYHPEICALVETALRYKGISLLIETTGIGWKAETIETIKRIASASGPRMHGNSPVTWIVSLDAFTKEKYAQVHGIETQGFADRAKELFEEAQRATVLLIETFGKDVWPQIVRMKENEEDLEAFWRFWKEKCGNVIVQKHDHVCRTIEDRRVADLSPLVRHPCWHLKRDLSIMIDGTVPLCREDLYALRSFGNAFTDDFQAIRDKMDAVHERHCDRIYEGLCDACDEYYTFNF